MSINLRGYGDVDNVQKDAKVMADIIARQGNSFIVDCIAESIGNTAFKFKLSESDVQRVLDSIQTELVEQVGERT